MSEACIFKRNAIRKHSRNPILTKSSREPDSNLEGQPLAFTPQSGSGAEDTDEGRLKLRRTGYFAYVGILSS
jgi:hypothetical protein